MAEVGDQHAGSEVIEPPAFRSPVIDPGAASEDGLGWRVGPQWRAAPGERSGRERHSTPVLAGWCRRYGGTGSHASFRRMWRCESHSFRIQDCRLGLRRERAAPGPPRRRSLRPRRPVGRPRVVQDRLHRLDDGHRVAVGGEVAVSQRPHPLQPRRPLRRRHSELHVGHFLKETPQHLDAIAALRALVPRLQEGAVVMMVGRGLQLAAASVPRPSPRRRACVGARSTRRCRSGTALPARRSRGSCRA